MIDIGKWSLQNRKLIYYIVAVLIIGGIWSLWDISKLEDPEIQVKTATVVTVYPGATAHTVELEVTDPLEKAIRKSKNILDIESSSFNDLSIIYVTLQTTTKSNHGTSFAVRSTKLPPVCHQAHKHHRLSTTMAMYMDSSTPSPTMVTRNVSSTTIST